MVESLMPFGRRFASFCREKGLIRRPDIGLTDGLAMIAVALWPLFFLTVRSWTNGFLIFLAVLVLLKLLRRPTAFAYLLKESRVLWILAALCAPFLAILLSQTLRGQLEIGPYDAPLRPLLAALVFLFLIERRIDFVRLFQWVCPVSIFFLAIELASTSLTTSLWGGRWATYFVDPLSLGQYVMLLAFFCLFSIDIVEKDRWGVKLFKFAGFLTGAAISIATASRSGWVAVPVLFAIWLLVVLRVRRIGVLLVGVASFLATCVLLYLVVDVVHVRVDAAILDYANYFSGHDRDTSAGLRLSMIRATWHLFLAQPLYGYGDGHFPPLSTIPAIASFNSQLLEYAVAYHGMHDELLQSVMRSGIFGLAAFVLMFFVPAVFFARAARSAVTAVRAAGIIGLTYVAAIFCFGLNTEVTNLKYLASFYGLMISCCAAQVIWAGAASGARDAVPRSVEALVGHGGLATQGHPQPDSDA